MVVMNSGSTRVPPVANTPYAWASSCRVTSEVLKASDWGVAAIERRGINQRLERGPGLALGLGHAVELAVMEVVPADHRLDLTGGQVEGNEGALGLRSAVLPALLALAQGVDAVA